MIAKDNIINKLIYILLFLFAINIFNQSSSILALVFIMVILLDRAKLYLIQNNKTFWVLVAFAISFVFFSAQNGINEGIAATGCPMAYYIGLRLQKGAQEAEKEEKTLKKIVFIVIFGMTSHAIVNFIYELIRFGGVNSGAIHYDFFSGGAETSATGAATYLTLFSGVIYLLIMKTSSLIKLIVGLIITLTVIIYDMILGGRTFFALFIVSFLVSFFIDIYFQKNNRLRFKQIRKILFIIVTLVALFAIFCINNKNMVKDFFESTYLFHRISYAETTDSQDLFSFFTSTTRGNIRNQYISMMFENLWGGRKILNKVGLYAHELWLDIFDAAGIIPFILMWVATIQVTIANILYIKNKNVPIQNKILLCGVTTSITIQFFFEPVLTGCRVLLFAYFLICGMTRKQLILYQEKKI